MEFEMVNRIFQCVFCLIVSTFMAHFNPETSFSENNYPL